MSSKPINPKLKVPSKTTEELLKIQGRTLWRMTRGTQKLLKALKSYAKEEEPIYSRAQEALDEYYRIMDPNE